MNDYLQCNVGAKEVRALHFTEALPKKALMQCNSMQAMQAMQAMQGRYMVRGQGVAGLPVAAKKVWKPIA